MGGVLAARLDAAILHFRSWGIKVHPQSRLPLASQLLKEIARTDQYPLAAHELVRVANALRIAFDFDAISKVLESQRSASLAETIRRACGGTLDDQGPTPSHRAQSELRFGATLAAGGLLPKVPPAGEGKTPDFIIELSGLQVGLEIKRPESSEAVISRLDDAVEQLAGFGSKYQAVVFDFTDCVSPGAQIAETALELADLENAGRAQFRDLCNLASDYISGLPRREKFGRVILFAATSQSFVWLRRDGVIPVGLMLAYPEIFHWACSGLLVEFGRDLRKRVVSGWEFYNLKLRQTEIP